MNARSFPVRTEIREGAASRALPNDWCQSLSTLYRVMSLIPPELECAHEFLVSTLKP